LQMPKDKDKSKKKSKEDKGKKSKQVEEQPEIPVITADDFDISCFTVSAPEDTDLGGGKQQLGDVKYGDQPLYIQTPWIEVVDRGIPDEHPEYAPTEESRQKILLPIDSKVKTSKKFFKKILKPIDKFMEKDSTKEL